jgi:RNA polymerase sigma factor (sigma-70 family)
MIVMQSGEQHLPGGSGPAPAVSGRPATDPARMAAMRANFIEFFDREYAYVVRFVMRGGQASLDAAEDAAQEAFVDAWSLAVAEPLGRWSDVSDPRAWIRTVALNKHRRPPGPRRRPVIVPVSDLPETPQPDLTHESLFVLEALHSLDEQTRAVMAFHLDGFPGPAIAAQLGITDQQARDLLKKARKILASKLAGTRDQERGRSM